MPRESIYKRHKPAVTRIQDSWDPGFWFIFNANKLLLRVENEKFSIPFLKNPCELELTPVRIQYLGTFQEEPCFSAEVSSETNAPQGMEFTDLRSSYDFLDEDIFLLAGKALQIISWDQIHQFCGRCGTKTEPLQGERAKKCPACGLVSYPRLSPAVIIAVLKDNKILLTHATAFKAKMYSVIAGFVEPGETLEECAKREILEEVGIEVKNIHYFGSQPWPFPHSMMIGFTAEYQSGDLKVDGKEISDAGWFDESNLPPIPGKISIARELIDWYLNQARSK